MSASDDGPPGQEERSRSGMTFLQGARELPEMSPAQIDRIEQRLLRPLPRARRPILSPGLAALVIVLVGGAALAVAGRKLSRSPRVEAVVGRLLGPAPARPARAGGPRQLPVGAPLPKETPAWAPAAADRAPAVPPGVAIATSTGASASTPIRPRRRQPEGTTPPTVAAPAAERELERPPAAVAPPAVGPASGSGEAAVAATGTGTGTGAASPAAAPAPPAAPENPIVAESRSFAAALERWHRAHEAKTTLAALDAHERRYPYGELRVEAQLLRAEVLLAGGQEREGLALLDPLTLAALPRARELRTVRGELRIKFGRCVEGKADLGAVIAEGASDPLARRARQALANCP